MIRVACACGAQFAAPDEMRGQQAACLTCGCLLLVGAGADPAEQAGTGQAAALPWARWLAECQRRFAMPPRDLSVGDTQQYLQLPGGWIFTVLFFVALSRLLNNRQQREIFRQGLVVWGHIIQANGLLFALDEDAGDDGDGAPGELVFSLDTTGRVNPEYLAHVAYQLKDLKGTAPAEPELRAIADYLTSEYQRVFGWRVPQRFSPRVPCLISTTFFPRKHLPQRMLCQGMLPIVVLPTAPHFAMPLPERYWPSEMVQWWTAVV